MQKYEQMRPLNVFVLKKVLLQLTLVFFPCLALGQMFKIQMGISGSNFQWNALPPGYVPTKEILNNHYLYIGMDYLNKKYFNLSSGIGYLAKSHTGQLYLPNGTNGTSIFISSTSLGYLSINTLLNIHYPTAIHVSPFFSFGPRFDFLVSNSSNALSYFTDSKNLNSTLIGLNLGLGVKYDLPKIQIGIRSDLLINFNNISDLRLQSRSEAYELSEKTQLYTITLGYMLN